MRVPSRKANLKSSSILRVIRRAALSSPWDNKEPIREELFGIERLEQHAESLAAAQHLTANPIIGRPLAARLRDNESVLLEAYSAIATAVREGRAITPAAEWLLDNYHVVEEQIREVRDDLPYGYYRQLPKLADGPFAGYPRVFGIAWAFVAHTDSRFDPEMLRRFVRAYQHPAADDRGVVGSRDHVEDRAHRESEALGRRDRERAQRVKVPTA